MFTSDRFTDPGGTSWIDRLRRLGRDLESLAGRLRDSIAATISRTLGEAIQSVLRGLLARMVPGQPHRPEKIDRYDHFERPGRSPPWNPFDRTDESRLGDDPEDGNWPREEWDRDRDLDDQSDEPTPPKIVTAGLPDALAIGMQTAAVWLRRWPGLLGWLVATGVGLASTVAAWLGGPAAAVVVGLSASALNVVRLLQGTDAAVATLT